MNNITISTEQKSEFGEIYSLIKTAFETAKVSDGTEQDYTNRLRENGYIEGLGIVAKQGGRIVGHVLVTKLNIASQNGKSLNALLLAPLSVAVEYRNKGIGASLVNEAIARAKALGYPAIVLVGDPAYYGRFGFKKAADFGITNLDGFPDEYVLVCPLDNKALGAEQGRTVTFPQ